MIPPLWRQRNFCLLWAGQGVSVIGSMLSGIARPFLILQLGGGAGQVSVVLALSTLPFVFFALPAGAWIDRWNRKTTMMLSDSGRGLAVGCLVIAMVSGHVNLAIIDITALIEGICEVFFTVAQTASLPQVVSKEQLSNALNYNQALYSIAFLVGPPLGGVLFSLNALLPFCLDAFSFLVSIVSLFWITVSFQQARPAANHHLFEEIRGGLSWLWHEPLNRYLVLMRGLMSFALGGTPLVIIQLVARALPHTPSNQLPLFTGTVLTFAGIGGILGALGCALLLRRFSLPQLICGSLWVQGAILLSLAFAPNYESLAALIVASYFLWPAFNAASSGYRLARIPDELQGRVNAVYRLFNYAGTPLGAMLVGVLLTYTSIAITAVIRGLLIVVIAVLTTIVLNGQREPA